MPCRPNLSEDGVLLNWGLLTAEPPEPPEPAEPVEPIFFGQKSNKIKNVNN